MSGALGVLKMTRRFAAPPEALFDAWLDPAIAGKWLFTAPTSQAHSIDFDGRVGGKWTIVDRREGVDYTAVGQFLEIDRPRRLVFSFSMPQFSAAFAQVTVELAADGAGTLITLVQEPLPAEAIAATEAGWAAMFDALQGIVTA